MSSRMWVLAVPTLTFLAACQPSVDVEQARQALLATDGEWMHSSGDPEKFASFYAADASFYPAGSPLVKGQAAIRDQFKQLAAAPGFALKWTVASSQVGAAADIGYLSGAYQLELDGGGEKGKYITVWKRSADGAWKVTDDIYNADEAPPPAEPAPGQHTLTAPPQVTWGDVPPSLPPGAKLAVLSGDPSKAAPFVVRLQMPAGYAIAPHWHPTDEHVTVLAGSFALGMGDALDKGAMTELPVGGYALMPAQMHHYAMAKTAATVQVHAMGPFAINYVNAADDPSRARN